MVEHVKLCYVIQITKQNRKASSIIADGSLDYKMVAVEVAKIDQILHLVRR